MHEIPDAKKAVENQVSEALAKVRQAISSSLVVSFEQMYEPKGETGVSYWGEALVELIGAYAKDEKITVLTWVRHWSLPEQAMEEFWGRLTERVYEELVKRIPDLKWASLQAYFFDSLEDLEKAAFYGGESS